MASGGQTMFAQMHRIDDRILLLRLQILICDGGLLVLRNILDQTLTDRGLTLSACLYHERSTITRLRSRGVITQTQYDILFPASGQSPTTKDMDITLVICLLRNLKCFGLNKKFDWNATPISSDVSVEADICRLRTFRNKVSHISGTAGIQRNDFLSMWNEIEQILVRRSSPAMNIHQMIADFKCCPLDLEEERRIQKELIEWKDYEAEVGHLKDEMKDIKTDVFIMMEHLEQLKRRQYSRESNKDVFGQTQEEIYQRRKEAGESNKDVFGQTQEEIYQRRKEELKDGLCEFYKTKHSRIFLSHLLQEKDTTFASFYIRPELSWITATQMRNAENFPVKSLSEIFEKRKNQEIYVLADAGLGKTAFSKYLANVWCQAHCPDEDMITFFSKDDIDCMQEFDFLFLVLLRDANNLCSIVDLIFENIVSNLVLQEIFSADVLLKILENEKCLVILDGLDEWTHPDKKCNKLPRSIPHRPSFLNDQEKCTVLTTSRPWKLGLLEPHFVHLGEKVQLAQLSFDSAVTLISRILQILQNNPNKDAVHCDTIKLIETISRIQNSKLASVPLLLIYTTCLWYNGFQIENSIVHLYINLVELLLLRSSHIYGKLQQWQELSSSNIPECFAEYENCSKHFPLLLCLGKLACYTLFNETKENTLVFDGSIARKYLTPDEMKFTMHSGMLSESTSRTIRKKFSKVSFSHKTVQEFFAAIFISSQSDALKTVPDKCRNVQDILDMSKICEFVSGMNADSMCEISYDLMSVINEDEITRSYRTSTGGGNMVYDNPLYNIQEMFMSCLQKMPESGNIQLCLQDFFINKDTEHSEQLQHLLKQNKTNIKSLYINTSLPSRSLHEIIDLFSLTDLSHIQKLNYEGYMEEEAEINQILFPSLQSVSLSRGKLTNDDENLARVQNLQYLYIDEFTLSHKILGTFLNFISGQKSMKVLTLNRLYCKEHGRHDCKRLNLDLSQHSTLSKLVLLHLPGRLQLDISTPSLVDVWLSGINLDESSLLLSHVLLNIERVKLEDIEMSAGSLQNFIAVLENLPQLVTVEMYAITPETEFDRVRENIRRSQNFHVIRDIDSWQEFKTIKPSKE